MQITKPLNGQFLDIASSVTFDGTAEPGVTSVELVADGQFPIPNVTLVDGQWSVTRHFSGPGLRHFEARGLNAASTVVSRATVDIHLVVSELNGYHPPSASLPLLGQIAHKLEISERIHRAFVVGGKNIFKLPGGAVYYDSLLDLDTDGSVYAAQDRTGDRRTSLHGPGGTPVDSNAVPYFVLPGGGFYDSIGAVLGDVAAVIFRDKIEFAVFADTGPSDKLGEGSIALHRSLGHETIHNGHLLNDAIDHDVITIVFPKSGNGKPQTPDAIRQIGRQRFLALGGVLPA